MSKDLVCSYIKDIAKHLWEPKVYGYASVMIGAGFSKNAKSLSGSTDMPDWSELTVSIYETLYPMKSDFTIKELKEWEDNKIRKTAGKNVLKTAEEYKSIFGRNKLDKLVEQKINDDKYEPDVMHKKLLELPWHDVFTTNYDTLLEKTISKINIENRTNYNIVTTQQDIPGSKRPRIIKLHGSIPGAKPYILTEEDYRTYPIKNAALVNTVQQAMLETQLCLIGFSGDDPNFTNWLGWLRDNMGDSCPKIYLCGIFNKMSESEKRLLENNNIIIVDISLLIEVNFSNIYEDALNTFFNKLVSYKKDDRWISKTILNKLMFMDDNKNQADSYMKLVIQLCEQRENYPDYISVNHKEINMIKDYIESSLVNIFRLDESDFIKLLLIHESLWLREKCYYVLLDKEAEKIEELLKQNYEQEYSEIDHKLRRLYEQAVININFSLLSMYRQDGRYEEIDIIIARLEASKEKMSLDQRSRIHIEKAKLYLQRLQINEVVQELSMVSNQVSQKWRLRKAFILSRIGYKEECLYILKNISAEIAQLKLDNHQFASITGYLDLCYRTLQIHNRKELPSVNIEAENSEYNVRNILNRLKEELAVGLKLAEDKERTRTKAFNPNCYTEHYGTTPKEIQNSYIFSFRYLIFLDELCLPVYNDHKLETLLAIKYLENTSPNPSWKWLYIIQSNDKKIIEKFFTREYILLNSKSHCSNLYHNLYLYMSVYHKEDNEDSSTFIYKNIIFDILSRLVIVEKEDRIIQLLISIIQLSKKKNSRDYSWIKEVYNRISYCVNQYIVSQVINDILELHLDVESPCRYFLDEDLMQNIEVTDTVINQILLGIKSDNIKIRDEALARLWLILKSPVIRGRELDIKDAIWSNLDGNIPMTKLFNSKVWNDFPHPADWSLKSVLKDKILEFNLAKAVNKGTISDGSLALDNVTEILHYFWYVSYFSKENCEVEWQDKELLNLIKNIDAYIENEKVCLKDREFDFFGIAEGGRRRFEYISELVSLIIFHIYIMKENNENVWGHVTTVISKLKDMEINTLASDAVLELIIRGFISESIKKEIENKWISNKRDVEQQAFLSLLYILSSNQEVDEVKKWGQDYTNNILTVLPYLYMGNSESEYNKFRLLMNTRACLDDCIRGNMTSTIIKLVTIMDDRIDDIINSKKEISGSVLDGMYNSSNIFKRWFKMLTEAGYDIPEEMTDVIKKLKVSFIPEVKKVWNKVEI